MSLPRVTRFSSRSAQGRRMMGSGERGVSICFTTLRAEPAGSGLSTRSPRPSSPRERSGSPFRASSWCLVLLCSGCCEAGAPGFLAEAELGFVAPHAVQDDGELAGDRDAGARHAAMLGDLHAPGPQARPFAAAHQQGVGGLVERGAGEFVATAADLALDVGLARLVARPASDPVDGLQTRLRTPARRRALPP